MGDTLATLDTVDFECKAPTEDDESPISPRRYLKEQDYLHESSASGWQTDVDIDGGSRSVSDISMAELWDATSDYEKVLSTLKEFSHSAQSIAQKPDVLARLKELNKFLAEDQEEPELKAKSVGACLYFLSSNKDFKHPDIVASPKGTVICQWRKDKHRNLTIEFLPDWSLHFVVFSPTSSETIRVSGRCSMDVFRKAIEPYQTERWTSVNAGR